MLYSIPNCPGQIFSKLIIMTGHLLQYIYFVKTRLKISPLRTVFVYENLIFTQEYAFAERCCFFSIFV